MWSPTSPGTIDAGSLALHRRSRAPRRQLELQHRRRARRRPVRPERHRRPSANNCTINGDIYADGHCHEQLARPGMSIARGASSDAARGASRPTAYVDLRSPTVGLVGLRERSRAEGDITLDGQWRLTPGRSGGRRDVETTASLSEAVWTIGYARHRTAPPTPVVQPDTRVAHELRRKWIDLPASASWGTRQTGVCTMTPAQLVTADGDRRRTPASSI